MGRHPSRWGHLWSGLTGGVIAALVITMIPVGAATGDNLVLGASNRSGRSTRLASRGPSVVKLNNTGGNPVLDLRNRGGAAPLVVDSRVRVANLNADRLDGKHARQLVRVAYAATDDVDDTAVFGSNQYADILSTTITAPTAGLLFIVAGTNSLVADSSATGDSYACVLQVNDTDVAGSLRIVRVAYIDSNHVYNDKENCSTNGVQEVGAGTHTIDLRVDYREVSGPKAWFSEASLQVLFVPFDATGAVPSVP